MARFALIALAALAAVQLAAAQWRTCNTNVKLTYVRQDGPSVWVWNDGADCSGCNSGSQWNGATTTCEAVGYVPPVVPQGAVTNNGNGNGNGNAGGNGGGAVNKPFSGRVTYYNTRAFGAGGQTTTGIGSCGQMLWDSDFVVAMNPGQYESGGACGKHICIGSNNARAVVMDLCPECAWGAIDLTPAAFLSVGEAHGSLGMLQNVNWGWC